MTDSRAVAFPDVFNLADYFLFDPKASFLLGEPEPS
jgi:hypothetical protein